LLEELSVVLKDRCHDPAQRLIVLDPSILLVGVLLRVLIGSVSRNSECDRGSRFNGATVFNRGVTGYSGKRLQRYSSFNGATISHRGVTPSLS
jgi:hypothetical protein